MPRVSVQSSDLAQRDPSSFRPVLPTLVFASYKGGVWKTSFAVAAAERLAFSGAHVLLVTCDPQLDACARLGLQRSKVYQRVSRGPGSVTVVGVDSPTSLVYGGQADGKYQMIVVDMPPVVHGGNLPGVYMVTPLDGPDAEANVLFMLKGTPSTTEVLLVRVGGGPSEQWEDTASSIEELSGRSVDWLSDPIPHSVPLKRALDNGESVWTVSRSGPALKFLAAVDTACKTFWSRATNKPFAPVPDVSDVRLEGWDT